MKNNDKRAQPRRIGPKAVISTTIPARKPWFVVSSIAAIGYISESRKIPASIS
jgi:hypothetical protein